MKIHILEQKFKEKLDEKFNKNHQKFNENSTKVPGGQFVFEKFSNLFFKHHFNILTFSTP